MGRCCSTIWAKRTWSVHESSIRIWTIQGCCALLVKWGRLEVSHRFPVHRRIGTSEWVLDTRLRAEYGRDPDMQGARSFALLVQPQRPPRSAAQGNVWYGGIAYPYRV